MGGHHSPASTIFVVDLTYKVPLAQIDMSMRDHVRFLKKYYSAGKFLVSGRKIPRDGGVILAVASGHDEIVTIMSEDPFVARGLADFRITQFRASQRADDIGRRIDGYGEGGVATKRR